MKIITRVISKLAHESLRLFYSLQRNCGTIFMLHDIGGESSEFNISIKSFEKLLQFMTKKTVIPITEISENGDRDNYVLTFDDVFCNVFRIAYPLLKKYQIPFTLFVSLELLNTEGYISNENLIAMSQDPLCTVGSHGMHHQEYRYLNTSLFEAELEESAKGLSSIIRKPIDNFAFPYGSVYACSIYKWQIAKRNNTYKYYFTSIKSHYSKFNIKHHLVPRVNVTDKLLNNLN